MSWRSSSETFHVFCACLRLSQIHLTFTGARTRERWRQSANDLTFLVLEWRCWWWVSQSAARLHRPAEPLRTWVAVWLQRCRTRTSSCSLQISFVSSDLFHGPFWTLFCSVMTFIQEWIITYCEITTELLTAHFLQVWYNIVIINSSFMFQSCLPFSPHSFLSCIHTWKLCELSHEEKGTSLFFCFFFIRSFFKLLIIKLNFAFTCNSITWILKDPPLMPKRTCQE